MKIETIYLVYENSDKTEGRGPMRHIPDSGFFTDEDAAWNFADTQCGIMGRKPQGATGSGSWRLEKYPGHGFREATEELERLLRFAADENGEFAMHTAKMGKFGRWLGTIEGVNEQLAERWPYGDRLR